MIKSVEAVYRNGKVVFLESPPEVQEARVIVTFLPARITEELQAQGISDKEAAELRWRLQAFAEDWERPEMDIYDDL